MKILLVTAGIQGPIFAGGIAKCNKNIVEFVNMLNNNKSKPILGLDENHDNIEMSILYAAHPYYTDHSYEYWKQHFYDNYEMDFLVLDKDDLHKTYGTHLMNRSYNIMKYIQRSRERSGERFDKIIFHDYQGIGFYTMLAKKTGIMLPDTQLIVNVHGNHKLSYHFGKKVPDGHNDLITMFMEAKSVESADLVISPSRYYIDWWKQLIKLDKYRVINNLVFPEIDMQNVRILRGNYNDVKKYSVTFFGRLEILKGLDVLINALLDMEGTRIGNKTYNEIMGNIEINFIGNSIKINGESSDQYIKRRCQLIGDKVRVINNYGTKEAFEFMKARNSLMVLPTLGETSSMVVAEAISNGIPFIASSIDQCH